MRAQHVIACAFSHTPWAHTRTACVESWLLGCDKSRVGRIGLGQPDSPRISVCIFRFCPTHHTPLKYVTSGLPPAREDRIPLSRAVADQLRTILRGASPPGDSPDSCSLPYPVMTVFRLVCANILRTSIYMLDARVRRVS